MTLTRPRLIAGLLCLLLALAAALLFAFGRIGSNAFHSPAADALRTFDVQEEPPPAALVNYAPLEQVAPAGPSAPASAIAVTVPRIAYTYGYSFRLDRDRIAMVQERHLALCRRLGPALCRVTAMQRGGTLGRRYGRQPQAAGRGIARRGVRPRPGRDRRRRRRRDPRIARSPPRTFPAR